MGKHIHAPDIVVQRAAESDSEEGAEKENAEDHKLTPFWYNKRTGKSITPSVEECLYQLCRESDADGSGDLDFDEYINMIHSPSLGLHLSISAFMGIKLWEAMQDLKDGTAIRNRLSSHSIALVEAGHGRVSVFSKRSPSWAGGNNLVIAPPPPVEQNY